MKRGIRIEPNDTAVGCENGCDRVCLKYESMMCGLFAAVECEDGKKMKSKCQNQRKSLFGTQIREQKKREGEEKKRGKQNKAVCRCRCYQCMC